MSTTTQPARRRCDAARHGTASAYCNHRCRCPEAVAARAAYRRFGPMKVTPPPPPVDSLGTVRRVRALTALGHRRMDIARQAGLRYDLVPRLEQPPATVTVRVAQRIAEAYDVMRHQPGPSQALRTSAFKHGWPTPAYWGSDIDNVYDVLGEDLPDVDGPVVDEVAIRRVLINEDARAAARLTREEQRQAVLRGVAQLGMTKKALAELLHVDVDLLLAPVATAA